MMGVQGPQQGKLFYININLGKRIRLDHPLRRIAEVVDFDFAYWGCICAFGVGPR
jgi:hypothetical protein